MTTLLALKTIYDPLHGDGYQLFSGIGGGTIILAPLAAWWHHTNCTHKGCWRKGHKDPQHGHPLCRKHQPKIRAWQEAKARIELREQGAAATWPPLKGPERITIREGGHDDLPPYKDTTRGGGS